MTSRGQKWPVLKPIWNALIKKYLTQTQVVILEVRVITKGRFVWCSLVPWEGKSSKVTIGFSPVWQRSYPPHPHTCSYIGSEPPRILSSPGLGLEPGLSHLNHPFSTVQKPEEIWKGNHVLCLGKGLGKWTPGRLSHENKRITIIWWLLFPPESSLRSTQGIC